MVNVVVCAARAPARTSSAARSLMRTIALDELVKQLPHLALRRSQRLSAQRSGPVHSAQRFPVAVLFRAQIAFPLQALEKRIKASWTDPVPVAGELLDHA